MSNDVSDLRYTIVPRSDQINADQLIGGPMTITITDVRTTGAADQPVAIHYEGENGRPYKPCLTMRKVLILAWGADGMNWVGKSMTLYTDPAVKWGNDAVGGLRISHMTDIPKDIKVSLAVTKGKKAMYEVKRMEHPQEAAITLAGLLDDMHKVKGQKGKSAMETLIERLPFEEQVTATEALAAHIARLQTGG